jgi:hypothetical protein
VWTLTDVDAGTGNPALPPLHNDWLATLTGVRDPQSEPKATCGDCVMCGGVERSGSYVTFSPEVKCCTYVPHLANFLVGRSLLGPGSASIRDRIGRRSGVTPLGLGLSQADIRRVVGAQSNFGHAASIVCPHFVEATRGCAIWQTRNAVCSTWFCKHERGAVGQAFWQAVRDLLIAAEERIARRCLTECGLPDVQIEAVLGHRAAIRDTIALANTGAALPESPPDDESLDWYGQMWGEWAGREADWFVRTAELAGAMTDEELVTSMAPDLALSDAVRRRAGDLAARVLPEQAIFSPGAGSEATDDVLRLIGYSPFDPLLLPAALQADLPLLAGVPLAELRVQLDRGTGPVQDDLLGMLLDYGVAVPSAQ